MHSNFDFHLPVNADIQLRIIEMRHLEAYFTLIEQNKEHIQTWMPWLSDEYEPEDAQIFIKHMLTQFANGNGILTGIWFQGQLVGSISLHNINWQTRKGDIGYWLAADMQGRGIVTRSCAAMITFAFESYHLEKIEISLRGTKPQ